MELVANDMKVDEIKIERLNFGYVVTEQSNSIYSFDWGPTRRAFSTLGEMLIYVLPLLGVEQYDAEAEEGASE